MIVKSAPFDQRVEKTDDLHALLVRVPRQVSALAT
jgi:hypothetical protein